MKRSLVWGQFHDRRENRHFEALVLRAEGGDTAIRLMAHVAYEASQVLQSDPTATNADLLKRLAPFLSLIAQRSLLSLQSQMGLTAELLFLLELLP